ncbi:MAG: hypothetical protein P8O97_00810 [Gammaproteobacteria bacterium]|nr:hypothetical protein [Gammaproteobacteria bacterium]
MRNNILISVAITLITMTLLGCKTKVELDAEQGHASAQYKLGMQYANGIEVEASNQYAHMWLQFSASQGFEKAKKSMQALEEKMSEKEISQSKELAEACVIKYYVDC